MEQERAFLNYRKTEILYQFKPRSEFLLKGEDVSFIRRSFLRIGGFQTFPKNKFNFIDMKFGVRRAHFLQKRPNPE